MRVVVAVAAWACAAGTLGAISGCSARPLAPAVDAAPFSDFFHQPTCGGTTTVRGTTPRGPFAADLVAVWASWGQGDIVEIDLADSQSRWVVGVYADWSLLDAGIALPVFQEPEYATAGNQADPTLGYDVSAKVDVSAATNPYDARDGGIPGAITLAMTISGDGFDLAGMVSSPYCAVFLDTTSDHRSAGTLH